MTESKATAADLLFLLCSVCQHGVIRTVKPTATHSKTQAVITVRDINI